MLGASVDRYLLCVDKAPYTYYLLLLTDYYTFLSTAQDISVFP